MASQQIAVVDFGVGNLHSVAKAITKVAPTADVIVTSDATQINNADRLIFPGVGSMNNCMQAIHRHNFPELMSSQIEQKPVMGICVGMQVLMQSSSEHGENVAGLGYFDAQVKWFNDQPSIKSQKLKVPHIGWNLVKMNDHELWQGIESDERFYFVHSYFVEVDPLSPHQIAATCHYGIEFTAAVIEKNLFAVQFHPEKSHNSGLKLLENFINWH